MPGGRGDFDPDSREAELAVDLINRAIPRPLACPRTVSIVPVSPLMDGAGRSGYHPKPSKRCSSRRFLLGDLLPLNNGGPR